MLPLWFLLLLLSMLSCHLFLRYNYSHFGRQKLPFLPACSWTPLGNLQQLLFLRISFGDLFQRIYADPSIRTEKLVGFHVFLKPALLLRDPELIRLVLIKRFDCFLNRYEAGDAGTDAMGSLTLPLAKYHQWRETRLCVSQLFISGCLKHNMYSKLTKILYDLEQHLHSRMNGQQRRVLPLSEMCQLYTTDVTGKLILGCQVDGLRHGHSQLRRETKNLLTPSLEKVIHFMTIFFLPHWTGLIRAKVFSRRFVHFMRQLVQQHSQQISDDTDLIEQLKQFQLKHPAGHYCQHPDFIASQAGIMLLAGFETSSALLSFTLYELAKQPELQQRLRLELSTAFGGKPQLGYEVVNTLPYLKMVCLEALRLYPAAAFINRECTPGQSEGFSLQPHVGFVVPAGMPVYISILGLHRDPKYWPQPLRFNPERFAPDQIDRLTPMTYIPFGAGPHGCVGSRLGMLQLKLGVAHILRSHRVEMCEATVPDIRFNPKTFMLESLDEIYLRFCREPC